MRTPSHVMVKAAAPRGRFRRAHLDFTNDAWRCFQVGTEIDLDPSKDRSTGAITEAAAKRHAQGVIGPDTYSRLAAEDSMLAVKSATAEEVEDYAAKQAANAGKDPEARLAEVSAKNAELEARLMKFEVAASADAALRERELAAKNAELEQRARELAAKEKELELRARELATATTQLSTPPAPGKGGGGK